MTEVDEKRYGHVIEGGALNNQVNMRQKLELVERDLNASLSKHIAARRGPTPNREVVKEVSEGA